jgi:O-antigen ligase
MLLQFALILWNSLFRKLEHRWKILWGFVFLGYLMVEFGSNQTPVTFYISHFTFDAQTGWYRLLIWQYGSASVANHPWFGIGFGDWARLPWMISSVDNFWLLIAMRHGIPAGVMIFAACLAVMCGTAFKKGLGDRNNTYRTAYLICMMTFVLVGCTVHFWTSIYVWFIFQLGSGVWIMDVEPVGAIQTKGQSSPYMRKVGS